MGSISVNLDKAVGYFAGRRGKVLEIMPLEFRDY